MRQWFPFTDYDFYGYLVSGSLALLLIDYVVNDAAFVFRENWTFVQIALAIFFSYVIGHLVAQFSAIVFEGWLARGILTPPSKILLGFKEANTFEKFIGWLVGRYYAPFAPETRKGLIAKAAEINNQRSEDIVDAESVFQIAFAQIVASDKLRDRVEGFRNQYGFCRNISFVGLVSTIAITIFAFCNPEMWLWAGVVLLATLGMTIRFLKFYALFAAEVLRGLLVK